MSIDLPRLGLALIVVPLAWLAFGCGSEPADRPAPREGAADQRFNVLLLLVDDLRPALGCYGDERARTPHIDRLAREGFLFERAYCQQALCHPSRTSLLLGVRPDTTGVHDLRTGFRARMPDAVTLPQLFREHGWTTLAMGKVHHGGGELDDAVSWSEAPFWPPRDLGYFTERGVVIAREREAELEAAGRDENVRGLATEAPDVADELFFDGRVTAEAHRRIDETKDGPFFLAVGFKKPHLPFVAPARDWALHPPESARLAANPEPPAGMPEFAGTSSGELRAYWDMPPSGPIDEASARELVSGYYACVSLVDRMVGELVDHLERAGLLESTIVVLLGDHGFQLGEHGMWCKHTNTEEATRTPLIVRLPDALAKDRARGARTSALVELVDVYPSLAELCGLSLPGNLEGTSFVPLLADPGRAWKRAAFSQYPVRESATGRDVMGYSMRTDRSRFTLWRDGDRTVATELYDYADDPLVTRNLAADPARAGEVRALEQALLAGWRDALPSTGEREH